MDKQEFIKDILTNSKYLSLKDRERLMQLCAKEMTANNIGLSQQKISHNPKSTRDFLKEFSLDDDFKWFTHDLDGDNVRSWTKYMNNAKKRLREFLNKVSYKTYLNVLRFISIDEKYKDNFWLNYNGKRVDYRWQSVQNWCEKNPNENPFNYLVDGENPFSVYIKDFKHTIQFRTDNPLLTFNNRIVNLLYDNLLPDINVSFSERFKSIGCNVYTFIDVRIFFQILIQVCKWINENKANSNYVYVDLLEPEKEDFYELDIIHKESYFPNGFEDKLKGLSGDLNKLRSYAFMNLDWEIYADCGIPLSKLEGKHIICMDDRFEGLWNDKHQMYIIDKPNKIQNCENVGGVKYIFKFYKL